MKSKYLHLSISLISKIAINVLVLFYVAKVVSVEQFGSFSLAFVISIFSQSIIDYGFNLKSLTHSGEKLEDLNIVISKMFFAKITISLICAAVITFFLLFTETYNYETKEVVFVLFVSSIFSSFGVFFANIFKAVNDYKVEAKAFSVQAFLLLILLGLNAFWGNKTILNFSLIILISKVYYFLYSYKLFKEKFSIISRYRPLNTVKTLKEASPYAIHLILGGLIIYIDTFILSIFKDTFQVGIYQAGMRIIMASMLITVIISDAFIPEISSLALKKESTKNKLKSLFNFKLLFTLLTVIILINYPKTIIVTLYSDDYLILKNDFLLIISIIILRYIGVIPGIILTSFKKQHIRANAILISVSISIILNLILIPKYNFTGAFISSLIAHIVLNCIYVFSSLKIQNFISFNKRTLSTVFAFTLLFIIQRTFFLDNFTFLFISLFINFILIVVFFHEKIKEFIKI